MMTRCVGPTRWGAIVCARAHRGLGALQGPAAGTNVPLAELLESLLALQARAVQHVHRGVTAWYLRASAIHLQGSHDCFSTQSYC